MKEVFESIIRHRRWMDVTCGSGSTMKYTEKLRGQLPAFLEKYNITSMLDAPCGDYSWMSNTALPAGLKYTGGDIVAFMIEGNRERHPGVDFRVIDLSQDALPDVDLLFCRDCLFHLAEADIRKVFSNIARSNIRWVLTTTYYPQYASNQDITTGDFRPIDLLQAPFNLPDPVDSLDDGVEGNVLRKMALWPREVFAQ